MSLSYLFELWVITFKMSAIIIKIWIYYHYDILLITQEIIYKPNALAKENSFEIVILLEIMEDDCCYEI